MNRSDTDIPSRGTGWRSWVATLGMCLALLPLHQAHALTMAEALAISAGDNDARIVALQAKLGKNDPAMIPFLQAMAADSVKVSGQQVFIVEGDVAKDAVTGQTVALPADAEDVVNNNRMSSEIEAFLAASKLSSPDLDARKEGIDALSAVADESKLPIIDQALSTEKDAKLKALLEVVRAKALLAAAEPTRRIEGARFLSDAGPPQARARPVPLRGPLARRRANANDRRRRHAHRHRRGARGGGDDGGLHRPAPAA